MLLVDGGRRGLCAWVPLAALGLLLILLPPGGRADTTEEGSGESVTEEPEQARTSLRREPDPYIDDTTNECYVYKQAIDALKRAFDVLQAKQDITEDADEEGDEIEYVRHSSRPADCFDIMEQGHTENGLYEIYPSICRRRDWGIKVFCELENSTGWTVILRRQEQAEQVDFYRNWRHYRDGFGDPEGEYWIGNEALHELSSSGSQQRLRIDIEDWNGNKRWAEYKNFEVAEEDSQYQLHLGEYTGDAGDALRIHDGMKFTTYDSDNDAWGSNCAERWKGGFWYEACYRANPMGIYFKRTKSDKGVTWRAWYSDSTVLKTVEFKIRPDISTHGDAW